MLYAWGSSQPWFVRPLPHRVLGVVGLVATPLLLWRGRWDVYDERVALALGLAVLSTWVGFRLGAPPAAAWTPTGLRVRARSAVAYLSDSSYCLYLVHFSLLIYLQTLPSLRNNLLVAIPLAILLANGLALLYWYLIERHYPAVRRAVRRSGLWPTTRPGPTTDAAHLG